MSNEIERICTGCGRSSFNIIIGERYLACCPDNNYVIMSNETKQTAVDWLGNEITNRITRRNPHDTIIIQTLGETLIELIEQAKEMEYKQMIEFGAKCIQSKNNK